MIFKDYYKILGIETNKVNIDEIKNSYREAAKKYHPDVNGNNTKAEERFKDINEAYRVLSDKTARRRYDRMWSYHIGKRKRSYVESNRSKDAKFSDFFNMFFGNIKEENNQKEDYESPKIPIKGENIETEINLSIPEVYFGSEKKVLFKTVDGGNRTFNIKVPEGIRNNEKIRLIGQGKEGKNGGKNGDLFIKIKITDTDEFQLDGINLKTNLYITPWEAALSTKVLLRGIDEEISVEIPKGIQTGEKICIKGKGYKDGKGGRGDLIAETRIMIPQTLTQEEKQLFSQMSKISKFNPRERVNISQKKVDNKYKKLYN